MHHLGFFVRKCRFLALGGEGEIWFGMQSGYTVRETMYRTETCLCHRGCGTESTGCCKFLLEGVCHVHGF